MTASPTAAKPIPPVAQVRPGLWSIPVPLPIAVRYVLVYAFETDQGPYLVDAGWNTDDAYDALCRGLDTAGFAMSDVQGVMVTHIHPDHYGLAGRVRESSDAWIALHPADAALIHDRYEAPDALLEGMRGQLRRLGAPPSEIDVLTNSAMPVRGFVDLAVPDVLLEDGERPDIPGWDLTSVWTPGHSPGHLCFWEPGNRVMLTGDCVLPRITPNIGYNPQTGDNPLGDYLDSLRRLATFEASALAGARVRVRRSACALRRADRTPCRPARRGHRRPPRRPRHRVGAHAAHDVGPADRRHGSVHPTRRGE